MAEHDEAFERGNNLLGLGLLALFLVLFAITVGAAFLYLELF
jgi:hypothetical protein